MLDVCDRCSAGSIGPICFLISGRSLEKVKPRLLGALFWQMREGENLIMILQIAGDGFTGLLQQFFGPFARQGLRSFQAIGQAKDDLPSRKNGFHVFIQVMNRKSRIVSFAVLQAHQGTAGLFAKTKIYSEHSTHSYNF